MGQNQPRSESLPEEGKHHISQTLKNRFGATFKERTHNVVNPKATGQGAASGKNPGKPT